jgi:hypothetical protein
MITDKSDCPKSLTAYNKFGSIPDWHMILFRAELSSL